MSRRYNNKNDVGMKDTMAGLSFAAVETAPAVIESVEEEKVEVSKSLLRCYTSMCPLR